MIALVFAAVCIAMPVRSILKRCVSANDALEDQTLYKEKALTFSEDYDKSNPLTRQRGFIRMLKLEMEDAEKAGDKDRVEMIKKQ